MVPLRLHGLHPRSRGRRLLVVLLLLRRVLLFLPPRPTALLLLLLLLLLLRLVFRARRLLPGRCLLLLNQGLLRHGQ